MFNVLMMVLKVLVDVLVDVAKKLLTWIFLLALLTVTSITTLVLVLVRLYG